MDRGEARRSVAGCQPQVTLSLFRLILVVVAFLCTGGCGVDGTQGKLLIVGNSPVESADHPATDPLRIYFDRYLAPQNEWRSIATVTSGDANFGISTSYDPIERAIIVQPRYPLRPHVGFLLTIDHERLSAMDGGRLDEDFELSFVTVPAPLVEPSSEVIDFETQLTPVIEHRCGCHGPSPKAFPDLVPTSLVGQASALQPERILVKPGRPLESYLVQRLLPDYPGTRGLNKTIESDELRLFIAWINQLAR